MTAKTRSWLREWLPAVMMTVAVLVAGRLAVTRKTVAQERIQTLDGLGLALSEAAERARGRVMLPQEAAGVAAARRELDRRLVDVLQPSLVQAELVKSSTAAGLTLKEISPLAAVVRGGAQEERLAYPRYRLRVHGSYRQIANYLDLCGQQRLPARVVGFALAGPTSVEDLPPEHLLAELTVETFLPRPPEKESQTP